MLIWRRELARKKDRPLFKILGNHNILTLVRKQPRSLDELTACKTLSTKQIHMFGHQLIEAIEIGLNVPDEGLPVYPRRRVPRISEAASRKVRRLKEWKEAKADSLAIDPALVLNKTQIMDIVKTKPIDVQDLNGIGGMKAWQVREFGEEIMGCLS